MELHVFQSGTFSHMFDAWDKRTERVGELGHAVHNTSGSLDDAEDHPEEVC